MQLSGEQKKLLRWIEAKQPPMIDRGLIESRPTHGARGQLVITDAGKTALTLNLSGYSNQ